MTHIQDVFLNDGMEYDADEKVKEYGEQILETGAICLLGLLVLTGGLAILQDHEQRRHRRRDLRKYEKQINK